MKKYFFASIGLLILINISCSGNQNNKETTKDISLKQQNTEKERNYNQEQTQKYTVNFLSGLSAKDSLFYVTEGINLAKQMYFNILTKLNKALDEIGPYEAVKYCNHQALPITDSLSKYYGVKAKRTSLKLRNPANAPDSLEKQILQMYAQTLSKTPVVIKTPEGVRFFTPIYIANVCLKCHGISNQDIPDVTIIALNQLYPKDEARNYQLYDIRGIWSILFPVKYQSKLNQPKP